MRRLLGVLVCVALATSLASPAAAKPWVRKAAFDGLYVGKVVTISCVGFRNCPSPGQAQKVSWRFTPTATGADMYSNTGKYRVKLDYVEGLGYYTGKVRFKYTTARFKMWATQQVRVDGTYTAYKIKGSVREWARRAPKKFNSTASITVVRKSA